MPLLAGGMRSESTVASQARLSEDPEVAILGLEPQEASNLFFKTLGCDVERRGATLHCYSLDFADI